MIEDAKSQLRSNGWASFHFPDSSPASMERVALEIASSLGKPCASRRRGPLIDHLVPTGRQAANPRSLSACFGLSEFPWHTDGAHWSTPPRYLVIGCLEADQQAADTLICDGRFFDPLNSAATRSAVFRVTNGGNSFYASTRGPLNRYYRYDPGCMTPMDDRARTMMSAMDQEKPVRERKIEWSAGRFLLFDNWRFLHRRTATARSAERKLLRVTVMENI
ncbi:TauD/TfdA family dioxygenase [Metapseudomonas otitidis]|uniref:TauD/TfdA family dioxygenase n=1 Tax=Metapseudomonas otitidis TaxID=319939 RepID=UPI00260470AA|nr:TauD/TfdA family dioxygenase [Pseudomonas otitidis]